jgi:hypothetical protein
MYQKLATVEQTSKAFFEDDGRLVLVIFVVLRSLNGQRLERWKRAQHRPADPRWISPLPIEHKLEMVLLCLEFFLQPLLQSLDNRSSTANYYIFFHFACQLGIAPTKTVSHNFNETHGITIDQLWIEHYLPRLENRLFRKLNNITIR